MSGLTHFDSAGHAHMVDVSSKETTERVATAEGYITMSTQAVDIIASGRAEKGDVLSVARLAGIMGAKQTSQLIPLCHPLPISKVSLDLSVDKDRPGVRVEATVKTTGQTGVEMEALSAVTIACLTVYDMVKAVEKSMTIEGIRLLRKDGGKSGLYEASN